MTAAPETVPDQRSRAVHGRTRSPLLDVVTDLHADVVAAQFPLELADAPELRRLRERVETQIGAHLLPRLKHQDAPAIVVVGGSTGVGKSTLVNSVVGHEISDAGVLRPTTTGPVVAIRPEDAWRLEGHPITALATVVEDDGVPAGLALLDAPDLDSVADGNRSLANLLLETADLWVFVTTASRYGDAVPWRVLSQAHARGISLAVVLNRVPRRVLGDVRKDLLGRLDGLGLGSAPLFIVDDLGPHQGLLPPTVVEPLSGWLTVLGGRSTSRGVVRRTTNGVWPGLREDLLGLADGITAQTIAAGTLRSRARLAVQEPAEALATALAEGVAARGAPTTRWLTLASTGGPLAPLTGDVSRLRRGWRSGGHQARSAAAERIAEDVRAALVTVITDAAAQACAAVRAGWTEATLGGEGLLTAEGPDDGAARRARAQAAVRQWAAVTERIVAGGGGEQSAVLETAGRAALLQAAAAGLSGATRALAGVLGPAAPALLEDARDELLDRAEGAVRAEANCFVQRLDALQLRPEAGAGLRLRASELKGHL